MKKLLDLGNRFAQKSSWVDFALTKFCLCAIGLLIGMMIRPGHKKKAVYGALTVFLATYLPLMYRLYKVYREQKADS